MPKDKSATNAKIIRAMRAEFLKYGYEKASLNRISAGVGISTAGLYKHFKGKEDMFAFLVKDTLSAFRKLTSELEQDMDVAEDYDPFGPDWAAFWTDFIYDHYDGVKLLICCSAGTKYESFEEDLIQMEAESNKAYAEALRKAGKMTRAVSDMQWHVLATSYVHQIFECVRHDMTKEQAREHMQFIGDLLYPGWKQLFELN